MTITSVPAQSATDTSTPATAGAPAGPARPRRTARPSARRAGAVLAILVAVGAGSAAWTLTARSDAPLAPAPAQVRIVEDGRWGGPDALEPRGPAGPRFGSADSLERRAG